MKITLTSAECQEILCEAMKRKFEAAFQEMAGIESYEERRYSTFAVKMDGLVEGSNGSSDIDFIADDIVIRDEEPKPSTKLEHVAAA